MDAFILVKDLLHTFDVSQHVIGFVSLAVQTEAWVCKFDVLLACSRPFLCIYLQLASLRGNNIHQVQKDHTLARDENPSFTSDPGFNGVQAFK